MKKTYLCKESNYFITDLSKLTIIFNSKYKKNKIQISEII